MFSDAPVVIEAYDSDWPRRFEAERVVLLEAIGPWLAGPIEHVGSTAVAGLAAKPVIDIMAGVSSLDASRSALPVLERLRYCYAPYAGDVMHWFCKPSPAHREFHLQLIPVGSTLWLERLVFRDHLRTHADVANAYAALKHRLAAVYRFDREAYTEAKTDFVRAVLREAVSGTEGVRRSGPE